MISIVTFVRPNGDKGQFAVSDDIEQIDWWKQVGRLAVRLSHNDATWTFHPMKEDVPPKEYMLTMNEREEE